MTEAPIYTKVLDCVNNAEEAIIKKYHINHPPEVAKIDSVTLLSTRLAWHLVEIFLPDKDAAEKEYASDFIFEYSTIIKACEEGNWNPMQAFLLEESEEELKEAFEAEILEQRRHSLLAGNAYKRLADNLAT